MTMSHDWEAIYAAEAPPPWDIGRPQPAFVRLAAYGLLSGRVLDPAAERASTLLAARVAPPLVSGGLAGHLSAADPLVGMGSRPDPPQTIQPPHRHPHVRLRLANA